MQPTIYLTQPNKRRTMMKPLFAALSVAFLLGTSVSVHAAEQAKPTDRSVQVYKKADLAEWNRENAAGGKGPLLGRFAFNRHQTGAQDAFREIGWLTLPPGASIGEHKHTDNEDVYIGQRPVYRQHGQTDPSRRRRHHHRPPRSVPCVEKYRQRAAGLP